MLVVWSPKATAMAVTVGETPSSIAAGIMTGPCTAHCPPPDGTKRFTRAAERKQYTGKVTWVENETNAWEMSPASPLCCIMPMMPP